jgi:GNAT superfamily N-acetyltransferase
VHVRPAGPHDASALAEIHVRSWQVAYRGLIPNSYLDALTPEARLPRWQEWLAAVDLPRSGTLVLVDDDTPCGFTSVASSRDDDAVASVGELTAIYLAPGRWRQGNGRLLLGAAVGALESAGFGEATLWVLEGNTRARMFYEATGWAPDGAHRTEAVEDFTLDEVRYRRSL